MKVSMLFILILTALSFGIGYSAGEAQARMEFQAQLNLINERIGRLYE